MLDLMHDIIIKLITVRSSYDKCWLSISTETTAVNKVYEVEFNGIDYINSKIFGIISGVKSIDYILESWDGLPREVIVNKHNKIGYKIAFSDGSVIELISNPVVYHKQV